MTLPDIALLTVDQIDKPKRAIVFALAADQVADVKAAKALDGTGVFRVGSDLPIGRVVGVELRKALGRAFVTVRFSDPDAWNKAKAGVFRAAQCKSYDGKLGSMNVVDAPFEDATVLRKAALDPVTALTAAMLAAGWDGRGLRKVVGDPAAILQAALIRARHQDALAKTAAPQPFRATDAWWASQGCKRDDDGLYGFDPALCRKRTDRLRAEGNFAATMPDRGIRH